MALAETKTGLMRPWVVAETEPSPHQTTFELGRAQMQRLQAGEGPIWLEMWVGGVEGGVYRVGRSMEFHTFSLVQMLVARRNGLRDKLITGTQVEVHDPGKPEGLPRYNYIKPDALDPILLEAQMAGALVGLDPQIGDCRARVVLEKALRGETFTKPKKQLGGSFSGNGNGGDDNGRI